MTMSTASSLQQFVSGLEELLAGAESAFSSAENADQLDAARVHFLGAKNGLLKSVQKQLGQLAATDKPAGGQTLNRVKAGIEQALETAQSRLAGAKTRAPRDSTFDVTLPGTPFRVGRLHPVTQTIQELSDIMGRLGFTQAEGPEVEDERHNFEALNIPAIHPARDPLDNFYLEKPPGSGTDSRSLRSESVPDPLSSRGSQQLLRSQTSTVQIRVMEKSQPPIRIISLGRVYRPDTADATHYPMFHQMEGLLVDRRENVSLGHLKTVLRLFASSYLGEQVPVRIRPSFFPFTEPSVEADYFWNNRWVEFGGAGMVDPNVFAAVGYDPEVWGGFAFGLGVERLCMIRHGILDIRDLFTNDIRFLRQF